MIRELDTIVLAKDIEKYPLKHGDIGAVVHCYKNNVAYEVEFVTAIGMTVAVLTLTPADIRPVYSEEILHVRPLKSLSMKAFA